MDIGLCAGIRNFGLKGQGQGHGDNIRGGGQYYNYYD